MFRGMVDLAKYQKEIGRRESEYDFTLSGNQGHCFIEKDKVIKIYRKDITNQSDLSSFKSERIAFPIYYIYENGKAIGEVMPYYKFLQIENVLNDGSYVRTLIRNYEIIKDEIEKFYFILMIDLCYLNILYDEEKGFYLIDTTSWLIDKDIKYGYIELNNMYYLNRALFMSVCHKIFGYDFNKINEEINNEYRSIKDKQIGRDFLYLLKMNLKGEEYKFKEFMLAYQEIIRINYKYDIETISDMKKYTKIMKNS